MMATFLRCRWHNHVGDFFNVINRSIQFGEYEIEVRVRIFFKAKFRLIRRPKVTNHKNRNSWKYWDSRLNSIKIFRNFLVVEITRAIPRDLKMNSSENNSTDLASKCGFQKIFLKWGMRHTVCLLDDYLVRIPHGAV